MSNQQWQPPSVPPPPPSPPPPSYYAIEGSANTISSSSWHLEQPDGGHSSSTLTRVRTPTLGTSAAQPPRYGSDDVVVMTYQPSGPSQPVPQSLTYSFSQLSYRSMLMFPPPNSPDPTSLYHISVEVNCFRPASHITVIRRGGTESGAYVGEFEIGLPARLNRVTIGSVAKMLSRPTLTWDHSVARFEPPRLRWNFDGVILRWDPATTVQGKHRMFYKCTSPDPVKKKTVLTVATFHPPDPLCAVDGIRPKATLTVEREWQHALDQILITTLILQQDSGFMT